MSDSASTEEISARWLLRREEADWSGEDQVEFDKWLNSNMENKVAYWRLEHGWRKADRLAALQPFSPAAAPRTLATVAHLGGSGTACCLLDLVRPHRIECGRRASQDLRH